MYEIIIREITETETTTGGKWTVVDKRPFTDEEIADANEHFRKTTMLHEALKEVYGYLRDETIVEKQTHEIYRQEMENLDVQAVIKAVNTKI